ncbi:hypothetical protein ACS0TY_019899 [Phlomoides rotata]
MADSIVNPATQRYALVTGANKGIGFEICRQLASRGIMVILTSRNEQRGIEALDRLKEFGVSKNVIFHQLDVADPATIDDAVEFIKTQYGRLDFLVNNAGINGLQVDGDVLILQEFIEADVATLFSAEKQELKSSGKIIETLKDAEECIQTNYYGLKNLTEALIPLLQLSDSPRIVNVSSTLGALGRLTEGRIDEVVQEFLKNFQEGSLEVNSWPSHIAAYKVTKAAVNAYTKYVAKNNLNFCVNSICPGLTRTDISCNLGPFSSEEAAQVVVKLALLPDGGPSGSFFEAWRREEVLSLYGQ